MSSSESEDNYDNNSDRTEELDGERTAIRSELSTLSFEELQKLKERVGAKVYKEAIFGKKENNDLVKTKIFKRENKNRPREVSSKKPVSMMIPVPKARKKEIRDPRLTIVNIGELPSGEPLEYAMTPRRRRTWSPVCQIPSSSTPLYLTLPLQGELDVPSPGIFDPLCGEFNKKQFADDYNFLTEMRMNDIKAARAELRQTTDPEKALKLRRLLQRLNEQHKSSRMKKKERMEMEKQKKHGEEPTEGRPYYKNKSEKRVEALVAQYEDLRKEGANRVQRHLKRRQQKVKRRSHRVPTGAT